MFTLPTQETSQSLGLHVIVIGNRVKHLFFYYFIFISFSQGLLAKKKTNKDVVTYGHMILGLGINSTRRGI